MSTDSRPNGSNLQINELGMLSRPQVDACVLAFLRNRGNWNTQAHTGRIVVDYAAHSKNIRVSEQLGTLGRQRIHVHVTGDKTQ